MRIILVFLAISLLVGIEAANRGRMRYHGRQLPFPGQPDATEQPWTNIDIQKVDHRQDSWQDETGVSGIENLDDTVVVGDAEMPVPESPNASRQSYPGWPETDEIPSHITQVTYTLQETTSQESPYQPPRQPQYPPAQPPPYQPPQYPPAQPPTYQPPQYPPPQPPTYQPPQYPPPQPPTQQPPQYPPPAQPTTYQPPQYPPPAQPTTYQPPQNPFQPNPISPPGCLLERGQFPSPNNCANYLNCWDDIVIEQTCPNELLFNDITGLCDFAYNVNCGNRPAATPKPPLPPGSKRCPDLNGRYRSPTNCSEFYVCLSGSPIKFNCPRGLVYNDAVSVCDYTYNVDCQGAATPKPEPLPRPEPSKPSTARPLPPTQPQPTTQQTPKPQPTFNPGAYPDNSWLGRTAETDPWHQRPVASQLEVDMKQEALGSNSSGESVESEPTETPTIQSPWDMMHAIPEELTKGPCENGSVHRLDDSCSSVIVCRNKRPQLVQCPSGLTYDRPSDSCRHFNIAKC